MDPAEIPWGDHGVDVVIESTGLFTAREKAAGHLGGGVEAGRHLRAERRRRRHDLHGRERRRSSTPAQHTVISNASCTTNCLAPMAKVLNDRFGIEQGLMTTVHAYTSDQSLQDLAKATRSGKPDLRRMRAAALSIIPSSTGAARAIGLVLPELKGKLDGTSLRVPDADRLDHRPRRPTSSREASVDEINAAFAEAAQRQVVPRRARVHRRAARVGRHRRQPVVVHLLGRGHDGERHAW